MLISKIKSPALGVFALTLLVGAAFLLPPLAGQDKSPQRKLRVDPAPIAADKAVKYDYDIVYVRAPRVV